jgi:ankyrin repeat protein
MELDTYLAHAAEEWVAEEAFNAAKSALLDQGLPFTEESLEECVKKRNVQGVSLFLKAGFSPNARDKQGVPLLNHAARAGDRIIAEILLAAGAELDARADDRGSSALIDSALGKHSDIARVLLAAGADVNIKSKDGQSALIISVGLSDEALVEMLLKAGAKADEPDALGASARKYAALFNKPGILELFNTYAG